MAGVLIGLDPGGLGSFGWSLVEDSPSLPLRLLASGVADHAADAVRLVIEAAGKRSVLAAGIDAPLFWVSGGDRAVDARLRTAICGLGSSGGTVMHVNSLQGACLVQGMMAGMLLRRGDAHLPISEAHPKALLWLVRIATQELHPSSVTFDLLSPFLVRSAQVQTSEHERDAAIGALSAWAMRRRPEGWEDLARFDEGRMSPLSPAPAFWMPSLVSAGRSSAPAR